MSIPSTTRCFSSVIASGLTLSRPTAIVPPDWRLDVGYWNQLASIFQRPTSNIHFPHTQQAPRQFRQLRHDLVAFLRHPQAQRRVHVDCVYARKKNVDAEWTVAHAELHKTDGQIGRASCRERG